MAPGEVKVLTLEQIDDLLRLEMIDEDTLVRQEGTEQWLALRVVAGLDDGAPPAPFAHSPSFTPPPPVRSAPPPPPAPLPPPLTAPAPPVVASVAPVPFTPPAPPVVASVAPIPFTPAVQPSRPSRIESLLIGLAALLGLLVALQRNGALAALFTSAGQGAAYASLETSLGGPGFGTPRAVAALVSQTRALPHP
jgi:hypothetical protein